MKSRDVLIETFSRIESGVHRILSQSDPEVLTFRPDGEANTIAWLIWHLTRGQDAQMAAAYDREPVWTADAWAARFDLPFPVTASGYGQSAEEVASVRPSAELLLGYFDATYAVTLDLLRGTADSDLDRVVDTRWNPPVTLAVRLVSILDDDIKHLGQAEYIRGLAVRAA
jgi:DinB superfamily